MFQRKRLGMKTTKLGFFKSKALTALRTLVQFQGIWCPLASMGNHSMCTENSDKKTYRQMN